MKPASDRPSARHLAKQFAERVRRSVGRRARSDRQASEPLLTTPRGQDARATDPNRLKQQPVHQCRIESPSHSSESPSPLSPSRPRSESRLPLLSPSPDERPGTGSDRGGGGAGNHGADGAVGAASQRDGGDGGEGSQQMWGSAGSHRSEEELDELRGGTGYSPSLLTRTFFDVLDGISDEGTQASGSQGQLSKLPAGQPSRPSGQPLRPPSSGQPSGLLLRPPSAGQPSRQPSRQSSGQPSRHSQKVPSELSVSKAPLASVAPSAPVPQTVQEASGPVKGPNAIEPVSLPAPLTRSKFPEATVASVSTDTRICYLCDGRIGMLRKGGGKKEMLAYLPCSHVFGHDCIFNYISSSMISGRCPKCWVTLRHSCEHLTLPRHKPFYDHPEALSIDTRAPVLPWNYGFCETERGRRLRGLVDVAHAKLTIAEGRKRDEDEPMAKLKRRVARKYRDILMRHAENRFNARHAAWWTARWIKFEQGPIPDDKFPWYSLR